MGTLAYGANDLVSPTGESLPFAAGATRVLLGALYVAVHLCWVAGLAMLLSVSTDAPLGAVGGAVMASIVSQILDQITALDDLRDYLPTHFGTAWSGLLADQIDWGDMTRGAFSAVAYAAVFFAAAVCGSGARTSRASGSGAHGPGRRRGGRVRACRSAAAARTTATPRRRLERRVAVDRPGDLGAVEQRAHHPGHADERAAERDGAARVGPLHLVAGLGEVRTQVGDVAADLLGDHVAVGDGSGSGRRDLGAGRSVAARPSSR